MLPPLVSRVQIKGVGGRGREWVRKKNYLKVGNKCFSNYYSESLKINSFHKNGWCLTLLGLLQQNTINWVAHKQHLFLEVQETGKSEIMAPTDSEPTGSSSLMVIFSCILTWQKV